MKKILIKSLLIVFVANLITGCSLKSDDLIELKPKLNNLTKRANSAIKRRGIEVSKVNEYLATKNPILMESFKDYDLKIKYENKITVVLVCKDEKALYEDLSCDLKIDEDYTNKDKVCDFYVLNPSCDK
ncbi:hypothetical protein [Halarcobacter sp.]|uniref:hypothetical protein n=1 Tax=Halarcobacter sp. TaxID=2321133 RepID=UPI002AAC2DEA|nr:hypothetical protein [Halarcobacter sp.]